MKQPNEHAGLHVITVNEAPKHDPNELPKLPKNQTCGDCKNSQHCATYFGGSDANDYCQFVPSRFVDQSDRKERTPPPPVVLQDLFPPYDIKVKNSHPQGNIPYHHQFAKRKRK